VKINGRHETKRSAKEFVVIDDDNNNNNNSALCVDNDDETRVKPNLRCLNGVINFGRSMALI